MSTCFCEAGPPPLLPGQSNVIQLQPRAGYSSCLIVCLPHWAWHPFRTSCQPSQGPRPDTYRLKVVQGLMLHAYDAA